jgi:hypothetical protein
MQRYKVSAVIDAARRASAPAAPAAAVRTVRAAPAVERRGAARPWVARKSAAARVSGNVALAAGAQIGAGDAVWKEF